MLAEAQFDRVFEEFVAANDLDLRLEAGTVAFSIGDWTFMIVVSSMGDAVTISAELGTVIEDPLHRMEAHLAERNTVLGPAFGLYYGIEAESRLIRLMQTRAVLGMSPESLGAMIDDFVGVVALERQELAVFLPALLRRADREAPAAAPGDEPWLRLWRRSLMSGVSGKGPPSRTTMSTTGRLSGSKRRAGALSNPAKRARTVKSPATLGKPVFPRLTQNATSGQITVVSESRERPSTGLIHKGRQIQGDHTTCFLALRHELRNAVLDTSPDEAMANLQATYDHDMALPGYGATPKWVTDPDIDSFASRFLQAEQNIQSASSDEEKIELVLDAMEALIRLRNRVKLTVHGTGSGGHGEEPYINGLRHLEDNLRRGGSSSYSKADILISVRRGFDTDRLNKVADGTLAAIVTQHAKTMVSAYPHVMEDAMVTWQDIYNDTMEAMGRSMRTS